MHPAISPNPDVHTLPPIRRLASPPPLSLCGEIQAGFMAPKLKLCSLRLLAWSVRHCSASLGGHTSIIVFSMCDKVWKRESEQMGFSRADAVGEGVDGVRPQSNFSSLLSLDGLSGSPLPLRPNVINWDVTLEVGVCMYV